MDVTPRKTDYEGNLHIIPKDDFPHELDPACICEPELYYVQEETNQQLWRHKWKN